MHIQKEIIFNAYRTFAIQVFYVAVCSKNMQNLKIGITYQPIYQKSSSLYHETTFLLVLIDTYIDQLAICHVGKNSKIGKNTALRKMVSEKKLVRMLPEVDIEWSGIIKTSA